MTITEKFKHCPFCGGVPRLQLWANAHEPPSKNWRVQCGCGAAVGAPVDEEDFAVERWNRRAEAAMSSAPTPPATAVSEPVAWIPEDIFKHLTQPKARSGLFEMAATERGDPWHKCTIPLYAAPVPAREAVEVKPLKWEEYTASTFDIKRWFSPALRGGYFITMRDTNGKGRVRYFSESTTFSTNEHMTFEDASAYAQKYHDELVRSALSRTTEEEG